MSFYLYVCVTYYIQKLLCFVKIVCLWRILYERSSVIFVIALYFGCITSQRSIQFGYLPHPLVRVIGVLFCVFWSHHS